MSKRLKSYLVGPDHASHAADIASAAAAILLTAAAAKDKASSRATASRASAMCPSFMPRVLGADQQGQCIDPGTVDADRPHNLFSGAKPSPACAAQLHADAGGQALALAVMQGAAFKGIQEMSAARSVFPHASASQPHQLQTLLMNLA